MRDFEYCSAVLYVAIADPTAPHAIPYRACVRQESGYFNPFVSGRTCFAGMRQSSKKSCEVTDARSENLPMWNAVVNPGVPFSTRNPRIVFSALAQTTATSAIEPLVIHDLAPLSTQESPSRRALVRMPPGFDPKSGSVRPKQPIFSPEASFGIQKSFCSFDPYALIGNITSPDCTEAKERSPESP